MFLHFIILLNNDRMCYIKNVNQTPLILSLVRKSTITKNQDVLIKNNQGGFSNAKVKKIYKQGNITWGVFCIPGMDFEPHLKIQEIVHEVVYRYYKTRD